MTNQKLTSFLLDDWRVSPPEGVLVRDGELVRLEPKAMEVLVYFTSRPGQVVTREELEENVWRGAVVGYDAVTNTVIKLRKALKDDARQPRYIATIPKKGYQLIAPISFPEVDDDNTPVNGDTDKLAVRTQRKNHRSWISAFSGVAIALVAIGFFWLWSTQNTDNLSLPSIAVLPFENLNGDSKQDYIGDGIAEDIITDLSRLSNIMVIASSTSTIYKGRQVAIEQIGSDLNVNFVLKGSFRKLDDDMRVNAQLVNAKTGFNTWAQRYDRKMNEFFSVQDEVTQSIVDALAVKLTASEKNRLTQRATNNLQAYDYFQEGQRLSKDITKEAYEQARIMYRKAIDLDPSYGRAYGAMAHILASEYRQAMTDTPAETIDRALELAKQAVKLDNSIPQTHWALGYVHFVRKEYEKAQQAIMEALSIAPNYADGYGLLALIHNYRGQPKKALQFNTKGMRLNPYYTWQYVYSIGTSKYLLGDYEGAINALQTAQDRNENVSRIKLLLAASYVRANRQDDAEWTIEQWKTLNPNGSLSSIENSIPIVDAKFKQMLLEDLRKAGIPN